MRTYEGTMLGEGLRFALVVARFNGFLTDHLLAGAVDALRRHGVRDEDLTVAKVPGTFEIPGAARRMLTAGGYDGLVALGAVIRGETPHFEYVAGEAVKGLGHIAAEAQVAVGFGIVTADNLDQAVARCGTKQGNKGADAALAALEQANLYRALAGSKPSGNRGDAPDLKPQGGRMRPTGGEKHGFEPALIGKK